MPLENLSRFRVDEPDPAAWRPAPITPVVEGIVLAFDQSIRKVGWSLGRCSPDGIQILATGMIRTEKIHTSHLDTFVSGEAIYDAVEALIVEHQPVFICHETPIVAGGRFARPDAALVAGMAIRSAARRHGIPVRMEAADHIKNRLTNDSTADKKRVREAIDAFLPEVVDLKPRNEDTYDSIAVMIVSSEKGPI